MKKIAIGVSIVIGLMVVVLAYLVFNVNSLVKSGIETAGPNVLGVPVTVDAVSISFMDGSGEIRGLRVANPEGYDSPHAIAIDNMRVALDTSSLTSDKIRILEVIIGAPDITYEGSLNDSNLKRLQANANAGSSATQASEETEGEPTALQLDYFEIEDAKLDVRLGILDKPLNLVMSSLVIEEIGKDETATPAEVVTRILRALNQAIIPLIRENASSVKSQLEEEGRKAEEKADKLKEDVDKVKKLFDR